MRFRRRHSNSRAQAALDIASALTALWALLGAGVSWRVVFPPGPSVLDAIARPEVVTAWNAGIFFTFTLVTALAWVWVRQFVRAEEATGKSLEELQRLSPDAFEEWVAARFRERGYAVQLVGSQGDHGVDLVVRKADVSAVVQCKKYLVRSVGEPVLRDLLGAMHAAKADKAYLVTTGRLTEAARRWTRVLGGNPIEIWDAAVLTRLSLAAAAVQTAGGTAPAAAGRGGSPTPPQQAACPRCGAAMLVKRNGATGERFQGCSRYPQCRGSRSLPRVQV